MIVYIAGPYRSDTPEGIEKNIVHARDVAIEVWQSGNIAITPHLNTYHFEKDADLPDEIYLDGDLDILTRCDAILMLLDWKKSAGASVEMLYAKDQGIPIYYYPDIPQPHITEKTRPRQAKAFIQTLMRMYRVHLSKNSDYSPANILGAGMIGLTTRLWDKVARLMDLIGFRIEIAESTYQAPLNPKHGSIDDTLIDTAVYAVIGLLLRKGVWGK